MWTIPVSLTHQSFYLSIAFSQGVKKKQKFNQTEKNLKKQTNQQTWNLLFCNNLKIMLSVLKVKKSSRWWRQIMKCILSLYQCDAKSTEQWITVMPKNLEVEKAQLNSYTSLLNFGDTIFFLPSSSLVTSSRILCWLFLISLLENLSPWTFYFIFYIHFLGGHS